MVMNGGWFIIAIPTLIAFSTAVDYGPHGDATTPGWDATTDPVVFPTCWCPQVLTVHQLPWKHTST